MSAVISGVEKGSLAEKYGILPGSTLLKINGHDIKDVLDYRFFMIDEVLRIVWKSPEGKFMVTKMIKKDEYDDPGMLFDTYLMDKQHSCRNKCIFCFVDQLPNGMRESLYFKDDDDRMSFFYGNYVTLTNMTEEDVDRIIKMHISPINVSVHTMNPELRVKMMKNKFAGSCLKYLRKLADAGIKLNTQLVLCPGINDGKELEYSLTELASLSPSVQSIACVPVGITKFREGLYDLRMYTKEEAAETVKTIEHYGNEFKKKYGSRICYPADEFYISAGLTLPPEDFYEGYDQLDNGVGICTLLEAEVNAALEDILEDGSISEYRVKRGEGIHVVNVATGVAVFPLIKKLACKVEMLYNGVDGAEKSALEALSNRLEINVFPVVNNFFGSNITVTGLITGQDLLAESKKQPKAQALLISESMIRTTYPMDNSGDDVLLDDMTTGEISDELGYPVVVTKNDGYELVKTLLEVGACQDR